MERERTTAREAQSEKAQFKSKCTSLQKELEYKE